MFFSIVWNIGLLFWKKKTKQKKKTSIVVPVSVTLWVFRLIYKTESERIHLSEDAYKL